MGKTSIVRVVLTNDEETRNLFWVKAGPYDIYCGVAGIPYHGSYHKSGEIRMTRQVIPNNVLPAAGFICYHGKDKPFMVEPPSQLGRSELLGTCFVPNDEQSFKEYEVLQKKKYDGIVYVDTRNFGEVIFVEAWASKPYNFFERMPKPPGFRSIFDFPLCWIVIDIGDKEYGPKKPL